MSDFKSKLPDFNELSSMASKFYKDVKTSVCEIISDYKKKHQQDTAEVKSKTTEDVIIEETKPKKSKSTVKKEDSEKKEV
ncbi:hypothetical protein [Legionella fairfieldensis]|uniref:hypothetical protein n=1 Tax=Legionella fairfieldensis TaxID=45064 RepID=UPI00048E15F1|nr:hypothetical protein [Legionella fairfieldensis]